MKSLIQTYTFSPNTKQVTLSGVGTVALEALLLITNVTTNTIIYNFADPAKGATVVGNTLTLDYNTVGMNSNDTLQIYYDVPSLTPATQQMQSSILAQQQANLEMIKLLSRIAKYCDALQAVDAQGRLRVTLDSVTNGPRNASFTNTGVTPSNPGANAIPMVLYDIISQPVVGYPTSPTNAGDLRGSLFTIADIWKFLDASRLNFDQCIRSKLTF